MIGDFVKYTFDLEKNSRDEYGFDLHCYNQSSEQCVGHVDQNSPAEVAGIRAGDRIVSVNGVPIDGMTHQRVISLIRDIPNKCQLTVSRPATPLNR